MPARRFVIVCVASLIGWPFAARAQTVSQRGFVEASGFLFPQDAPNDPVNLVGDVLVREELFVKPAPWIQFAAGLDARANTHDQVDHTWRIDFSDRGTRRPALAVRRLSATIRYRHLTVDAGKQFIRWGKTDIVTPTDHFAPRDFLNVVDNQLLAVTGVRMAVQAGAETVEAVVVPRLTPSRVPLIDQRWSVVPPAAPAAGIMDGGAQFPDGSQAGVRWAHTGAGYEYSLSYFDGFNHLPNIDVVTALSAGAAEQACPACAASPASIVIRRTYPAIKSYGADAAVPTRWFTIKGETAYFTSSSPATDEYLLYVVQLERQTGEWLLVAGYVGEAATERRAALTFAPDRGLARSIVARASYTIDSNRSLAIETAVRQDGAGVYVKPEYSQAHGQHWRTTAAAVLIAGREDDFLGQYRRNSHLTLTLRYSF
ncbi:MAG TPA: hypothetical protein VG222_04910 [Vicinamibacterales bacterium]|jgi:hypothetical protein|nr:hypothetical protein [Vicinamibacterales bacterium]